MKCLRCSAELSTDPAGGTLCPACLLEAGLAREEVLEPGGVAGKAAENSPSGEGFSGRRFGDYELLAEIARGGQGVVYRARHTVLKRNVALKMIPSGPWSAPGNLKRLRREAQAIAELDHPGIVPIYEIGEVDGQHYFSMKLIGGTSLGQRPRGEALPARQAAELIAEVARAVQHAHERGILHRDIKPGNILLDEAGKPHLTDFGLAKLHEGEATITRTRDLLGTPSYVSPEMAKGASPVGPATDVYGLGAVLYQLLTGAPPFAGGTTLETLRQVADTDPVPPRRWSEKIDRDVEIICLKCLEKEPSRRYESAGALADDLDRWLGHKPIRARPARLPYRARKWLRRHALAVTASAMAAFAAGFFAMAVHRMNAATGPSPSLAVVIRAADPASKLLAAEYARDLIHALDKVPGLNVAPRGSVLRWETTPVSPEQLGRTLGVPTVLQGTVKVQGDRVDCRMQLVSTDSGRETWSREISRDSTAGNELIGRAVRLVATNLGVGLGEQNRIELSKPLTASREAWVHYMRGRQLMEQSTETDWMAAIREFDAATTADPDFAEAYCGESSACLNIGYQFRDPSVWFPLARRYVDEALRRDETLPGAIINDGVLKFFYEWDWKAAESAVQKAILLDPSALDNNGCFLHCQRTWGDTDAALATVERAVTYHPGSLFTQIELGCASYYAGKPEQAVAFLQELREKAPDNVLLLWNLARAFGEMGRFDDAAAILQEAGELPRGKWSAIVGELGWVRARQGRTDVARAVVVELEERAKHEYVNPYLFAIVHAGLGDKDDVFHFLQLAADSRSPWFPSMPTEPKFNWLHDDPRYRQLLDRLHLPRS